MRPEVPVLRCIVRADLPQVKQIDDACFIEPFTDEDWEINFRLRCRFLTVAEVGDVILAWMMWDYRRSCIRLQRIAVAPKFRHKRVGKMLLDRLAWTVAKSPILTHIEAFVNETDTAAALWLKAYGFRAVLVPHHFGDRDAYRFTWRPKEGAAARAAFCLKMAKKP